MNFVQQQCEHHHQNVLIERFHLSGHTLRFHWTVQDSEVFLVWSNSPLAESGLTYTVQSKLYLLEGDLKKIPVGAAEAGQGNKQTNKQTKMLTTFESLIFKVSHMKPWGREQGSCLISLGSLSSSIAPHSFMSSSKYMKTNGKTATYTTKSTKNIQIIVFIVALIVHCLVSILHNDRVLKCDIIILQTFPFEPLILIM